MTPIATPRVLLLLLFLASMRLSAQDIHFSQFGNAPLNLNPALTGAFQGDYRFRTNYRNQWNAIVPYNTFSGSAEKNFCTVSTCDTANFWRPKGLSLGLLFNYDVAGDANLSLTQLELSASYTKVLSPSFSLAGALMLGGGQRSFDPINLVFDEQFDGKQLNPNGPSQENFEDETRFLFDLSTGLNLHYQSGNRYRRTGFDIGLGLYHLTRPVTNFYGTTNDGAEQRLPRRLTAYGLGVIELLDRFDLLVNLIGQFQGPYQEILLSGGARFHLNPSHRPGNLALDLSGGYRLNDAFVLLGGLSYKMWQFGLSYDINTSDFRRATDGRGGPEFSLGYIIFNPSPVKICPTSF